MKQLLIRFFLLFWAIIFSSQLALAQEVTLLPINKTALTKVMGAIDKNEKVQKLYEGCPADTFDTANQNYAGDVDEDDVPNICRKTPRSCLKNCLQKGDATQCFDLALVFQDDELQAQPVYSEKLFALACARGSASGCTNRGAGLASSDDEKDPWQKVSQDKRDLCAFRSFKISCQKEDAWGCYMHGNTHSSGEGTKLDNAKARAAYEKTCKIDPEFTACDYAKSSLKYLDE